MIELTPTQQRALRAQAHHLHPVVSVAGNGLTPAVLKEIDAALQAHQLIKIRVYGEDRGHRDQILASVCRELSAAAVQHIGKTLIVWRERIQTETGPATPSEKPKRAIAKAKSAKALSARRGIASLTGKSTIKKPRWFPAPVKTPGRSER